MKVREALGWFQCEELKTSYAAGIKAYADQMLRNCIWVDMEKVLLGGSKDWDMRRLKIQ